MANVYSARTPFQFWQDHTSSSAVAIHVVHLQLLRLSLIPITSLLMLVPSGGFHRSALASVLAFASAFADMTVFMRVHDVQHPVEYYEGHKSANVSKHCFIIR
jgi:hypothetical protein